MQCWQNSMVVTMTSLSVTGTSLQVASAVGRSRIAQLLPCATTYCIKLSICHTTKETRKPSCCWQTYVTRKHAKNCSNSTCLQRCRWQNWPIFIRLTAVASEICEIPRNSLKIQTYRVQGHPKSLIFGVNRKHICNFLLVINSNFERISYSFRDIDTFSYKIACFPHPPLFDAALHYRHNLYIAEKYI